MNTYHTHFVTINDSLNNQPSGNTRFWEAQRINKRAMKKVARGVKQSPLTRGSNIFCFK